MLRKPNQTLEDLKNQSQKILHSKEERIEYDAVLILALWSAMLLSFFAGLIIGLLF